MKVAVSIPDPVFAAADVLAKRLHTTRSDLYARALGDFLDRHEDDRVTAAINKVIDEVGGGIDPFVEEAGRRILRSVEW